MITKTNQDKVPVKPEIKLRSLTELTGSQSPIDPKTRNIFDNEEESFSDMIQRHQTGWMDLQVPAAAANTSMDSIAGMQ